MVLNLHSFWGYDHGSGIWQTVDFFRESTSVCAVDCFVLISGFFGIKWRFKSFFNLVFQIFFYSIGVYLVCVFLGVTDWSVKAFLLRFTCLFANSWGFAVAYVLLYFCSPALNALVEKSSSSKLFIYIIVAFLVINFISVPRKSIFTYSMIYLIGRLLNRLDVERSNFSAGKWYWYTTFIIFASVYFVLFKSFHITDAETVCTWPVGLVGYDYAAPFVILQAVFLFMFFAKLKLNSKFINWCAASCFSIFLIHMHPTIKEIGYYTLTRSLYDYPAWLHILMLLGIMIVIFFASILIDKVRIYISDLCYKLIQLGAKRIPQKWFNLDIYMPRFAEKLAKS